MKDKKIFDYNLPKELIAVRPLEKREEAKLMIVDRNTRSINHTIFKNIIEYFQPGEILVLNNTKVIPARLYGRKNTGGLIELLLLEKKSDKVWEVLVRGKVKEGTVVMLDNISAILLEKKKEGSWLVKFDAEDDKLFEIGKMPIPPYIKRFADEKDNYDYQTVYAKEYGSVAAPTAGLHFTQDILNKLKEMGIIITFLTLHIGWASFKRLTDEGKKVPAEFFEIPGQTAEVINEALLTGKKICAVGTSTVRAIESSFEKDGIVAKKGYTDLFIEPGYKFHCINKMITNFHLPESTHLYMVCAFGGTELICRAYKEAIQHKYRFYSYGDAMLII